MKLGKSQFKKQRHTKNQIHIKKISAKAAPSVQLLKYSDSVDYGVRLRHKPTVPCLSKQTETTTELQYQIIEWACIPLLKKPKKLSINGNYHTKPMREIHSYQYESQENEKLQKYDNKCMFEASDKHKNGVKSNESTGIHRLIATTTSAALNKAYQRNGTATNTGEVDAVAETETNQNKVCIIDEHETSSQNSTLIERPMFRFTQFEVRNIEDSKRRHKHYKNGISNVGGNMKERLARRRSEKPKSSGRYRTADGPSDEDDEAAADAGGGGSSGGGRNDEGGDKDKKDYYEKDDENEDDGETDYIKNNEKNKDNDNEGEKKVDGTTSLSGTNIHASPGSSKQSCFTCSIACGGNKPVRLGGSKSGTPTISFSFEQGKPIPPGCSYQCTKMPERTPSGKSFIETGEIHRCSVSCKGMYHPNPSASHSSCSSRKKIFIIPIKKPEGSKVSVGVGAGDEEKLEVEITAKEGKKDVKFDEGEKQSQVSLEESPELIESVAMGVRQEEKEIEETEDNAKDLKAEGTEAAADGGVGIDLVIEKSNTRLSITEKEKSETKTALPVPSAGESLSTESATKEEPSVIVSVRGESISVVSEEEPLAKPPEKIVEDIPLAPIAPVSAKEEAPVNETSVISIARQIPVTQAATVPAAENSIESESPPVQTIPSVRAPSLIKVPPKPPGVAVAGEGIPPPPPIAAPTAAGAFLPSHPITAPIIEGALPPPPPILTPTDEGALPPPPPIVTPRDEDALQLPPPVAAPNDEGALLPPPPIVAPTDKGALPPTPPIITPRDEGALQLPPTIAAPTDEGALPPSPSIVTRTNEGALLPPPPFTAPSDKGALPPLTAIAAPTDEGALPPLPPITAPTDESDLPLPPPIVAQTAVGASPPTSVAPSTAVIPPVTSGTAPMASSIKVISESIVLTPSSIPLVPSRAGLPLTAGGVPLTAGGVPLLAGSKPVMADGLPLSAGAVPVTLEGVPVTAGGVPVTVGGFPVTVDGLAPGGVPVVAGLAGDVRAPIKEAKPEEEDLDKAPFDIARFAKRTYDDEDKNCACQKPHEKVAEVLKKNFDGHLICFSQPQCLLLQGCISIHNFRGKLKIDISNCNEPTDGVKTCRNEPCRLHVPQPTVTVGNAGIKGGLPSKGRSSDGEVLCIHHPLRLIVNGCCNVHREQQFGYPQRVMPFRTRSGFPREETVSVSTHSDSAYKSACSISEIFTRQHQVQHDSDVSKFLSNSFGINRCGSDCIIQRVNGTTAMSFLDSTSNNSNNMRHCNVTQTFKAAMLPEGTNTELSPSCPNEIESFNYNEADYRVVRDLDIAFLQRHMSTQYTKDKKYECVHSPACTMVPKCFQLKESSHVVTADELRCRHEPSCVNIPICSVQGYVKSKNRTAACQCRKRVGSQCRVS